MHSDSIRRLQGRKRKLKVFLFQKKGLTIFRILCSTPSLLIYKRIPENVTKWSKVVKTLESLFSLCEKCCKVKAIPQFELNDSPFHFRLEQIGYVKKNQSEIENTYRWLVYNQKQFLLHN